MHYFTHDCQPSLKSPVADSEFFTVEMSQLVAKNIPHRVVSKGWRLAFSRSGDGASYDRYDDINRLLRKCRGKGELLIVLQDIKENIFGGYFSQNLEVKPEYFGTGESFLFVVKVLSCDSSQRKG